ncbi:MAG: hypothetical protein CMO81_09675 [Waddliaceae bacterium]|nr:hypothetical protein [Waddliaceae bacterium]
MLSRGDLISQFISIEILEDKLFKLMPKELFPDHPNFRKYLNSKLDTIPMLGSLGAGLSTPLSKQLSHCSQDHQAHELLICLMESMQAVLLALEALPEGDKNNTDQLVAQLTVSQYDNLQAYRRSVLKGACDHFQSFIQLQNSAAKTLLGFLFSQISGQAEVLWKKEFPKLWAYGVLCLFGASNRKFKDGESLELARAGVHLDEFKKKLEEYYPVWGAFLVNAGWIDKAWLLKQHDELILLYLINSLAGTVKKFNSLKKENHFKEIADEERERFHKVYRETLAIGQNFLSSSGIKAWMASKSLGMGVSALSQMDVSRRLLTPLAKAWHKWLGD